ncbi:cyclic pyranopterin monophosphate synthase MoaC [Oceanispirochaeta crateris]|uniref:cyclic pyranopterin monophosphate synthase n=1 Tax=Oceanispirochaeta crateris TaxID=2518645 RepID=A0A5C1QIY3_9SPIO|nr:cyclic pyranopterin monophosphate synthase MoaC [Oceanispirochaeta crateris]QEN06524.1 cyclic pyranopterin monophosphate synthase MoaC [Oceanispirochaeta crateris]
MKLSHIDDNGQARMVDVSAKPVIHRTATATAKIFCAPETMALIQDNQIQKGDVLTTANIAGVIAAKQTSSLIPLCHNISMDQVVLELQIEEDGVRITAKTVCTDKTGIEMEALTAVSVAALTVYDMCKAVDKKMMIGDIQLLEKTKSHR